MTRKSSADFLQNESTHLYFKKRRFVLSDGTIRFAGIFFFEGLVGLIEEFPFWLLVPLQSILGALLIYRVLEGLKGHNELIVNSDAIYLVEQKVAGPFLFFDDYQEIEFDVNSETFTNQSTGYTLDASSLRFNMNEVRQLQKYFKLVDSNNMP